MAEPNIRTISRVNIQNKFRQRCHSPPLLNAPRYGSFFRTEILEWSDGQVWPGRIQHGASSQCPPNDSGIGKYLPWQPCVRGIDQSLCEDVQLKDERMSHGFGNNVEIRHCSLGAVAEFEQSGQSLAGIGLPESPTLPALICPCIS